MSNTTSVISDPAGISSISTTRPAEDVAAPIYPKAALGLQMELAALGSQVVLHDGVFPDCDTAMP